MPILTNSELALLSRFSNKIYDFIYQNLNLSEVRADEITREVILLIVKRAENK